MDSAMFEALKAKILAQKQTADKVAELGGINEYRVQSDKLGMDWLVTSVNGVEVKKVYVEQAEPKGVADNPIAFVVGVVLIPNAYYVHEGTRYVYMGTAGVAESWDAVSQMMVEF